MSPGLKEAMIGLVALETLTILKNKKKHLIRTFAECLDLDHGNYNVLISTCYFNCDIARGFLKDLNKHFKINRVIIMIDEREVRRIGIDTLMNWQETCNRVKGWQIEIWVPEKSNLFHVKSYCVYRGADFDEHGWPPFEPNKIRQGVLCIGSANLTSPGMGEKAGNFESFYVNNNVELVAKHIKSTYYDIESEYLENLDDANFEKDNTTFKFSVINEGIFGHKIERTIEQHLEVRLKLNEHGKSQMSAPEFVERLGYSKESASLSKRYFQFRIQDQTGEKKSLPGIETYLGRWVPKALRRRDSDFGKYVEDLASELDQRYTISLGEIEDDFQEFQRLRAVDPNNLDSAKYRFEQKCKELLRFSEVFLSPAARLNSEQEILQWKLEAFCNRWEFFEFPYDIKNDKDINEVYEDLYRNSLISKSMNKVQKAFREAHEQKSLEPFKNLKPMV